MWAFFSPCHKGREWGIAGNLFNVGMSRCMKEIVTMKSHKPPYAWTKQQDGHQPTSAYVKQSSLGRLWNINSDWEKMLNFKHQGHSTAWHQDCWDCWDHWVMTWHTGHSGDCILCMCIWSKCFQHVVAFPESSTNHTQASNSALLAEKIKDLSALATSV